MVSAMLERARGLAAATSSKEARGLAGQPSLAATLGHGIGEEGAAVVRPFFMPSLSQADMDMMSLEDDESQDGLDDLDDDVEDDEDGRLGMYSGSDEGRLSSGSELAFGATDEEEDAGAEGDGEFDAAGFSDDDDDDDEAVTIRGSGPLSNRLLRAAVSAPSVLATGGKRRRRDSQDTSGSSRKGNIIVNGKEVAGGEAGGHEVDDGSRDLRRRMRLSSGALSALNDGNGYTYEYAYGLALGMGIPNGDANSTEKADPSSAIAAAAAAAAAGTGSLSGGGLGGAGGADAAQARPRLRPTTLLPRTQTLPATTTTTTTTAGSGSTGAPSYPRSQHQLGRLERFPRHAGLQHGTHVHAQAHAQAHAHHHNHHHHHHHHHVAATATLSQRASATVSSTASTGVPGAAAATRPCPMASSSYTSTSSIATTASIYSATFSHSGARSSSPSPASASPPDDKNGCENFLDRIASTSTAAALATAAAAASTATSTATSNSNKILSTSASLAAAGAPGATSLDRSHMASTAATPSSSSSAPPSRPGSRPSIRVASNSAFEASTARNRPLYREKEAADRDRESEPGPTDASSRRQRKRHRPDSGIFDEQRSSSAAKMPEPPVLSFWGPDPVPLPTRFARIKRNLISGHEAELEASWTRLIEALRHEVDHIEGLGAHLVPSIQFSDVDDPAQTARFGHDLRRYGVGVVRSVMPRSDAEDMVQQTVGYLEARRRNAESNKSISPPKQDPTCFDYFWTPAQVRSRAHPGVLRAQRFMMGQWETSPDNKMATRLPITYVDRIRIHGVYDGPNGLAAVTAPSLNAAADPLPTPPHVDAEPLQSADDWITALQSSAGVIAQVDNGSLERWEPDGYQRAGTYNKVFHGQWEDYDPWECASRVSATMDLYNGYGACTIFRMYQGVLALSTVEPGMIRLMPSPKLATAYYLLRPFFSPKKAMPETRDGPEWEAYLAPDNWKLQRDPDTIIHGAVPGHAQRITERWHPHLYVRNTMITLPTLQPGDYIFWHPDLPYHISSNGPGLATPNPNAMPGGGSNGVPNDITMLVYVPAAPLTQTNALYLARQRKAFQRGHPGPDFDSTGRGTVVEDPATRPGESDIAEVGGPAGLQAMGLAPWEVAATRAGTPPPQQKQNRAGVPPSAISAAAAAIKQEAAGSDEVLRSPSSSSHTSSSSTAEAEVVRLSNIILFPDHSMMGYSV